jgi:hypothetical protein
MAPRIVAREIMIDLPSPVCPWLANAKNIDPEKSAMANPCHLGGVSKITSSAELSINCQICTLDNLRKLDMHQKMPQHH